MLEVDMVVEAECDLCGDKFNPMEFHAHVVCDECWDENDLESMNDACRLIPVLGGFRCSLTFDDFEWVPDSIPSFCPQCGRRASW